jgi:pyrimidine operon attenuation protein/uracil phosphoribosyltransferase
MRPCEAAKENEVSDNTQPSPQPPSSGAILALDSQAIDRALRRIGHEIIERNPDLENICIVGIPSRGIEVAQRIAAHIEAVENVRPEFGVIDVSMHRDDIRIRPKLPMPVVSHLPQDLDRMTLILTDDVLFSGRTIRAAMDAISSFGRPKRIQLAVLVDRSHRELPIRADYVGKNLPTSFTQRVYVRFQSIDNVPDSVWMDKA